jgi:cysteine-S-conjugate beta-lyase
MTSDGGITDLSLDDLRRRRSAKWTWYEPDVLPAWVAEMDFALAPAISDVLREAVASDDAGYASPDAAGLGSAFAGFAQRRFGWTVDPAQVTPLNDVVSGLYEFVRVLSEPGDGVIINPPVYHPFFPVITETGRTVVEVPVDDRGKLDLDALGAAFAAGNRLMILCNPHNPTGSVLDRDELARIAEIAAEHDGWVLADEIHSPMVFAGSEHVAFTTVSDAAAERGIVLTSASKAFNTAGLKCAIAVTASATAAAQVARLPEIAKHCGHLGVLTAVAAWESCDDWLDEVIAALDTNRTALAELLAEHLPEVGYTPPAAGYLAWLDCRALGLGGDPSAAFLERGRVALSPGPQFGTGGAGFARLNFATSPELLAEAVTRMAASMNANG